MAGDEVRVVKEMGISHKDFFRILPRALAGLAWEMEGTRVQIGGEGQTVEIVLSEERQRALGTIIRIPVTRVELVFSGYSDAERAAFIAEFDRQYFRGGG